MPKTLSFQLPVVQEKAKTVGNSLSVPVLNMSRESSDRRHGHRERCDSKEKKELPSPRAALDASVRKFHPGVDPAQVKKMSDLLKRELNFNSDKQQESGPRRQPLYVTPEVAGTKTRDKEVVGQTKYESSMVSEVWDSTEKPKESQTRVFTRMKNAAFLVSKINSMEQDVNKKETLEFSAPRRGPVAPLTDECNFSLRKFRRRLLGKHTCLADAFRVLDLNVNQKIGPQEWGAMFRGSGLATFREARISFELLDLNRDGEVTLAEFQAALEGVAEISGIDGLRKRLVAFGYTKTLQALEVMEAVFDPERALNLEEFGLALCRIHVVEPEEHRAIFDNVRDGGDPYSKASLNDLLAALGSVGPSLLLEDLADRARQKWETTEGIWAGLGPGRGDSISLQAFERKLVERLGFSPAVAQKASRILDVDAGGELSRSELLSALALSRPTLHMEDFRRKVQQRYRSIEAVFRESFEHLEHEDLNNDDDMRLSCEEFAEILEALDFSRRETSYLFWLADANNVSRLTLYEFFRGVKLFVPSCIVEGLRLQALANHRRISEFFQCGISWDKRLNFKAFGLLLDRLQVTCEEPRDTFDFLDVRSQGTICLREVVALLQNVMPGTKERSSSWESDRKAEKDVRAFLAPLHKTVTDLKTTMKQDIDEEPSPASPTSQTPRSSTSLSRRKMDTTASKVLPPALGLRRMSDAEVIAMPRVADYCGKKTVDGLCGYFQSTSNVLDAHDRLLSHHYSRTDWHKNHTRITSVLERKI
ncbi:unnamed protein product [Effrenium voratum]|nr:unnamed protein product [Effrenium voratum]